MIKGKTDGLIAEYLSYIDATPVYASTTGK
jgi:hypothetical protein